MRSAAFGPFVVLTLLASSSPALAQSIIKNPGEHVNSVELEPHLVLRWFDTPHRDIGFGLGARATVPIVDNGFIPSINNSVGIGFGVDWMRYDACGDNYGFYFDCGKVNHFSFPVVMQWNFFLSRAWSVFGEPGLALNYYHQSCGYDLPNRGHVDLCPSHTFVDPVFFAGARWHFSNYTALTFRVGWPYSSIGVSFLLRGVLQPIPQLITIRRGSARSAPHQTTHLIGRT